MAEIRRGKENKYAKTGSVSQLIFEFAFKRVGFI